MKKIFAYLWNTSRITRALIICFLVSLVFFSWTYLDLSGFLPPVTAGAWWSSNVALFSIAAIAGVSQIVLSARKKPWRLLEQKPKYLSVIKVDQPVEAVTKIIVGFAKARALPVEFIKEQSVVILASRRSFLISGWFIPVYTTSLTPSSTQLEIGTASRSGLLGGIDNTSLRKTITKGLLEVFSFCG